MKWKRLKIKRLKRIKFVNDHKEEIEKLKEQPTFNWVANTPLAQMKVPELMTQLLGTTSSGKSVKESGLIYTLF